RIRQDRRDRYTARFRKQSKREQTAPAFLETVADPRSTKGASLVHVTPPEGRRRGCTGTSILSLPDRDYYFKDDRNRTRLGRRCWSIGPAWWRAIGLAKTPY